MGSSTGYQNQAVSFFPYPGRFLACWKACKGQLPQNTCLCSHRQANIQPIIKQQGQSQHGSQASSQRPNCIAKRPAHAALYLIFGDSPDQLLPIFLPFYSHSFKQQVIITVNPFPTGLILRPLLKASKASHLKSTDTY